MNCKDCKHEGQECHRIRQVGVDRNCPYVCQYFTPRPENAERRKPMTANEICIMDTSLTLENTEFCIINTNQTIKAIKDALQRATDERPRLEKMLLSCIDSIQTYKEHKTDLLLKQADYKQ